MGWSRSEVRRHRRRRLHRLAPRRGAARPRATRCSASTRSPTTTTASRKERNAAALDVLEADLADAPLEPILAGADGVFHLAGQPGVRASWGESFQLYLTGTCSRPSASSRPAAARSPRRLRVVLVRLRRRRALPDAGGRRPAADLARTGSRSSRASSSRARSGARRGSTPSCCGTSRSTGRGSGRTWRSPRMFEALARGDSVPALRRRQRSAELHVRRRRRGGDDRRDGARPGAARSTTSAAATRRR